MSSSESQEPALSAEGQSKKKEAAKLEKLRHKQEVAAAAGAASNLSVNRRPLSMSMIGP
jgi:hypothetical protein